MVAFAQLIICLGTYVFFTECADCGEYLNQKNGILSTPNFPKAFKVPIRCKWVIDANFSDNRGSSTIVVYLTQLLVTTGLRFTEFDYYEQDSTFQLGGRLIHEVTEQNVTSLQWIVTSRQYLVVEFVLERLEGNHLRVLDNLLDVYGFNMTFETRSHLRQETCTVLNCSLSGHCFASLDYEKYWCSCFPSYSGPDCGQGPLCQSHGNYCENGALCRQLGAMFVTCVCDHGYTGSRCEMILKNKDCENEEDCTTSCQEYSLRAPCNCDGKHLSIDGARYEGTIRLTNVSAVRQCIESSTSCSLKPTLEKQVAKYLRSANLSMMEDLQIINISTGAEIRFHFWGGKRDGSRVRESLNRLVQRGRLGNITLVPTHLAITQEPSLYLQKLEVNQRRPLVRQREEFVLSCSARGSSKTTFKWFKDGVPININRNSRNMWTRLLPLDSEETYKSLLGIQDANPLDHGRYTCQVSDWGVHQCKSLDIQVVEAPKLKLDPMSITVEKGDNVSITCISSNELQQHTVFGYSWTKNNALFRMVPKQEFWEDLYPSGSILKVYNVQKSAVYTCHVHGSVASVSKSVRMEMLNRSIVPWCATDVSGIGGVGWNKAGPGVLAKVECPARYSGVATRLCLLIDKGLARWQTPDFSDCISDELQSISINFKKVTLGYGITSTQETISGILNSLRDRGLVYPGEGEPSIELLQRVVIYLNATAATEELLNTTKLFYSTVNTLLQHRNAIINHQKVGELQQIVQDWATLWGTHLGTNATHLSFDKIVVELFRYELSIFRKNLSLHIPRPNFSYPSWFSARLNIYIQTNPIVQNGTSSVAVVTYNNLSQFLPQRYSQTLENGTEVQYEIASIIVSIIVNGPLKTKSTVELEWNNRLGWELRCGISYFSMSPWNLTVCQSIPITRNRTLCICPETGSMAALIMKEIILDSDSQRSGRSVVVMFGCVCCLTLSTLTFIILLLQWWQRQTCIVFLKLQCCSAVAASMVLFIFAMIHAMSMHNFPYISTSLQGIILVGMSSHISILLLVYTEIVYLHRVEYIKQTIISTITGVPLLVVLCNHMAQSTGELSTHSWWLQRGTMEFYTCISCGALQLFLFIFLYCSVWRRLNLLVKAKKAGSKKAYTRRIGLLNRAAAVFTVTVVMSLSSVLFTNVPGTKCQYVFSFSCAFLGFVLLFCYILHNETPLQLRPITSLHLDDTPDTGEYSENDVNPLNIFTKEDAEAESEAEPTICKKVPNTRDRDPQLVTKKEKVWYTSEDKIPVKEETIVSEDSSSEIGPTISDKLTDTEKKENISLEKYPGSPRKFKKKDTTETQIAPLESQTFIHSTYPIVPHTDMTTTRVCVITSVVVDSPSVVVCSVDVEPCSGISDTNKPTVEVKEMKRDMKTDSQVEQVRDADVMDRICHDLDYLLNRESADS